VAEGQNTTGRDLEPGGFAGAAPADSDHRRRADSRSKTVGAWADRLFTIAVDAEKSAAGLLGPGDRVDVQLFVRKDARANIGQPKSKVILQNIRVFAVDQAVQRSPDGGEERRIAKTVSLLVKPDQANKLTLAQNLGQVSLIPRNPDDEESSAVAEVSTDELFGEAEKSSRAKEQGIDETTKPAEPDTSALITAVQAVPPKPPFVMEIVEANAVRTMDFDAETGKPIREPNAKASGPTVHVPSASGTAPADDAPEPTAADPSKMLDDFPISASSFPNAKCRSRGWIRDFSSTRRHVNFIVQEIR
jgi:hypothetical protein